MALGGLEQHARPWPRKERVVVAERDVAPRATASPWFMPCANPRLRSFKIALSAAAAAYRAAVCSEPLSTTISS